jgi:hypothetical protein
MMTITMSQHIWPLPGLALSLDEQLVHIARGLRANFLDTVARIRAKQCCDPRQTASTVRTPATRAPHISNVMFQ